MRKYIIVLLIIAVAVVLVGCGAGDDAPSGEPPDNDAAIQSNQPSEGSNDSGQSVLDTQPADDDPTEDTPPAEDDNAPFSLLYNGFTIQMDQNITEVLAALGEPLGIFEAPSCAFDGIDRIFRFPGMQIHTYPLGEEDFVHTISIRDDSILLDGDLYLGNSWEDFSAMYGDGYVQDVDMFTYTKQSTTLSFLVEEGNVTAITYGLIME